MSLILRFHRAQTLDMEEVMVVMVAVLLLQEEEEDMVHLLAEGMEDLRLVLDMEEEEQ